MHTYENRSISGLKIELARGCLKTSPMLFAVRDFLSSEKTLKQIQQGTNPHHGSAAMLRDLILEDNRNMSSSQTKYDSSAREVAMLKELEVAFGRGGIQSFALEGVLGELQVAY